MASLTADRRLYVTADRSRVVEHGDLAAAFLLVSVGSIIDADDVARYRLTHDGNGKVVLPDAAKPPEKEPPPVGYTLEARSGGWYVLQGPDGVKRDEEGNEIKVRGKAAAQERFAEYLRDNKEE